MELKSNQTRGKLTFELVGLGLVYVVFELYQILFRYPRLWLSFSISFVETIVMR